MQRSPKPPKLQKRHKRLGRSAAGSGVLYTFLALMGAFMALPLVYAISNAFKPLDELFVFPPKFFVRNPTWDNFSDLFTIIKALFPLYG